MKNIHVSIESGTDPRIFSGQYAEPLKITVGERCVYDSSVSSSSSQPQVTREKETHEEWCEAFPPFNKECNCGATPTSGWIRTADRPPTKEDGDEWGHVLVIDNDRPTDVCLWNTVAARKGDELWPYWMRIPTVPKE